jgi:glycosyltransferase involved in cell wall biosynthesis
VRGSFSPRLQEIRPKCQRLTAHYTRQQLKDKKIAVNIDRTLSKKTLIIVPAYNEDGSIGRVAEHIRKNVPQADILVVDDGSNDRTARRARESGAMVISLPYNMGIGSAVQSGFLFAKQKGYHFAVQVDGDGQHPASEIPRLLAALENGSDMAIGSRFVQSTNYRPPFLRSVGIKIFSFLVSLIVGKKVYDTTSGFRACGRKAIVLLTETYPHDYPEVEALITLHRNGMNFVEIPVEMNYRQEGKSSISAKAGVYYMLKVTLAVLVAVIKRRNGR